MDARHLLCIRLRYADCAWTQPLAAAGWEVHMATDLNAAHRLMKEYHCRVGVLVSGQVNESACAETCAELDTFLRTHRHAEWVGVFEPAFIGMAGGRDQIGRAHV